MTFLLEKHCGKSASRLGRQHVEDFLLHLVRERQLSPGTHNVYASALRFLFRVLGRPNFLLPIEVMSVLFRDKMLAKLKMAWQRRQLDLGQAPVDPEAFPQLLNRLYGMDWVVYAKRPFGGPEQVLRYLGQYTHRTGISNHRLVCMGESGVTFRTKSGKRITLAAEQFLGRFVQHLLPDGFVKIRHYSLLAAGNVRTRLKAASDILACREASNTTTLSEATKVSSDFRALLLQLTGIDLTRCPVCGSHAIERRPLQRAPPVAA